MKLRAIDVCSGAGGFSIGLARAGYEVLGVELDPDAVATHRKYAGPCAEADITTWKPPYAAHVVVGGVPCFIAGTMVLTRDGYTSIEALKIGMEVLTHRGRWRRITNVMERDDQPLVRIKAQGVPGVVTTPEHPFYATLRGWKYSREINNNKRVWSDPDWVTAEKLTPDHFLGQIAPPVERDSHTEAFWWLVGRYLADGWIADSVRKSQVARGKRGSRINSRMHRVVICCAEKESANLAQRIAAAGFKVPSAQREKTVTKFHINSVALVAFLRSFGRYAHGKLLPSFALALSEAKSRALLDGYLSGDGCEHPFGRSATTVSKALALSIALLAQRAYGVVASIMKCVLPKQCVIEGRTCNQRDFYRVTVPTKNRSATVSGEYGWKRVNRTDAAGRGTVFNLSVEEDESYIADGAIVHNCQSWSQSGQRGGFDDPRGQLYLHLLRIAVAARAQVVVMENVKGLLSWRDKATGVRAIDVIVRDFRRYGFRHVVYKVLTASHYGVAQARERIFIVGFLDAKAAAAFAWPPRTHGAPGNRLKLTPYRTVRQALNLGPDRYAERGRVEGANGWQGQRVLDVDAPAPTVNGRNNSEHISPLDKPSPTLTCREHNSSLTFGSRGAKTAPRRAGDILNPALARLDAPAPTIVANAHHQGRSARASQRPCGELAHAVSVLDRPAPTVTARESLGGDNEGNDPRPSRRPWARLAREAAATNPLDAPAATVSAGGTDGGGGAEVFGYRGYRDRLAAALEDAGLADRPATTVNVGPKLDPAGHHAKQGARAVNPLTQSGLLDRPATTVDTTSGISPAGNHHRQKRAVRLTAPQCAALQDFPPGMVFAGNKGSQHRQIGNAVPPTLGRVVGEAVAAALRAVGR